nr:MAG TPA: hypothetical protein [Caudoviricetes sp.]
MQRYNFLFNYQNKKHIIFNFSRIFFQNTPFYA